MADGLSESTSVESLNPSDLLVADTDPLPLDLCRNILEDLKLTIRGAQDADMVMDALESGLVDILLLSQDLPGAQDFELLRHIHYWYPETQVVVIADSPSYSAAVQATRSGAFDYLAKPLDSIALRH